MSNDFFTNYLAITILPALWAVSIFLILFGIFGTILTDGLVAFAIGIPLLFAAVYFSKKWYDGL